MAYKRISGKICIPRIYDRFVVSGSGWEVRCAEWIATAMEFIGIPLVLEDTRFEDTVVDYKCALPCDIKLLRAIEYEGCRLPKIETINTLFADDLELQEHDEYSYQLDRNGYAVFTFEEGDIIIHYKRLPLEYDEDSKIWFPLIIDKVEVLEAIDWYIATRLLSRGYTLSGFSLDSRNPYTNPAMQWDTTKKSAANSLVLYDVDDREEISRMIRTFIQNYNGYNDTFFDNSKITY